MTETGQDQSPLEGRELTIALRRILAENPDRHEQEVWLGNAYLTPDELSENGDLLLPLDMIRPYAMLPVRPQPEETGAVWPVCGSTGCVCGWGAVLSAPAGSFIRGFRILTPDGEEHQLDGWVARKMGINSDQASHLFSPLRGRERLIRLLDALIENPETDMMSVL
jgi:hypothetical protein